MLSKTYISLQILSIFSNKYNYNIICKIDIYINLPILFYLYINNIVYNMNYYNIWYTNKNKYMYLNLIMTGGSKSKNVVMRKIIKDLEFIDKKSLTPEEYNVKLKRSIGRRKKKKKLKYKDVPGTII